MFSLLEGLESDVSVTPEHSADRWENWMIRILDSSFSYSFVDFFQFINLLTHFSHFLFTSVRIFQLQRWNPDQVLPHHQIYLWILEYLLNVAFLSFPQGQLGSACPRRSFDRLTTPPRSCWRSCTNSSSSLRFALTPSETHRKLKIRNLINLLISSFHRRRTTASDGASWRDSRGPSSNAAAIRPTWRWSSVRSEVKIGRHGNATFCYLWKHTSTAKHKTAWNMWSSLFCTY